MIDVKALSCYAHESDRLNIVVRSAAQRCRGMAISEDILGYRESSQAYSEMETELSGLEDFLRDRAQWHWGDA